MRLGLGLKWTGPSSELSSQNRPCETEEGNAWKAKNLIYRWKDMSRIVIQFFLKRVLNSNWFS